MADRHMMILGATSRDTPGMVQVSVVLRYLKSEPVESVPLTPSKALRLAEELVQSARHAMEYRDNG